MRVLNKLIKNLLNKDPQVRQAAAAALEEKKDLRAVEPLIALLKDEDWEVRKAARVILKILGKTDI